MHCGILDGAGVWTRPRRGAFFIVRGEGDSAGDVVEADFAERGDGVLDLDAGWAS